MRSAAGFSRSGAALVWLRVMMRKSAYFTFSVTVRPLVPVFSHHAQTSSSMAFTPASISEDWTRSSANVVSEPTDLRGRSGTTGRSKGVIVKAENAVRAAVDTVRFDRLDENDSVLAYLPLAWVGDHYLNYAQALVAGFCLACPESGDTVMQDMREIGPTFYFAPPRVFEQMLTRVTIRMEDASRLKRRMFQAFLALARRYGERILDRKPVPLGARLAYAAGELLVYGPLKNALGLSRVRTAYTAGEAIGPDLFSFYRSIGLNLKQLYGQTEAFLYVIKLLALERLAEVNSELHLI